MTHRPELPAVLARKAAETYVNTPPESELYLKYYGVEQLEEVCAIELGASSSPWTPAHIRSSINAGHVCVALCDQEGIQAHAIISVQMDEAELLILSVAEDKQRRGLATMLLRALFVMYAAQHFFLEVRESNHAAILLYKKLGFTQVGMRRHYYPSAHRSNLKREHALIMRRAMNVDELLLKGPAQL